MEVIQAFHTVRIVLYIGCSGPVVEILNKINMKQSTTGPLGQNTRYTELCIAPLLMDRLCFLFCLVFAMSLCASVYMCFVVTYWERADLLGLLCGV